MPASPFEHRPAVYIIENVISGDFYIGSTYDLQKRMQHHRSYLRAGNHHTRHLQNAWNKYGEAAFEFRVLEYLDGVTMLREREQHYVDTLQPAYNKRKQVDRQIGVKHTTEARRKMSEAIRRACVRPETQARRRAAMKGRRVSAETREKLRAANLGSHHSEETKRGMRERYKGRQVATVPPEALARMAETKRRRFVERRAALLAAQGIAQPPLM